MTFCPSALAIQDAYPLTPIAISPFGRHFLLRTTDGRRFLLKPVVSGFNEAQSLYNAMQHLIEQGFLNQLPWLSTHGDLPFIPWNGQYWALIPWVCGRTAPVFSKDGFPIFLRLFKRLHSLGHNCPYGTPFHPVKRFGERFHNLSNGFGCYPMTHWAKNYQSILPSYLPRAQTALYFMNDAPTFSTLCHGDPSPANTRLRPDGEWILVDWDRLVHAPRWWELAQITRRYGCYHSWRPHLMRSFLRQFLQIAELVPEERWGFFGSLLFPQELWRIGHQYFIEDHRPESWFTSRFALIQKMDQRRLLTLRQWQKELLSKEDQ